MQKPTKVLITGGREVGGLTSVVNGLTSGFEELGIPVQVIPPTQLLRHWRDLRDPDVLCILNTTGVLLAPFARRAICVAHGIPVAGVHGWRKMLGYWASFKLANVCAGAQLVAVSNYVAAHLENIFAISVDGVVHNPVLPVFLEPYSDTGQERMYITYVGRLIKTKNVQQLLPAIRAVLDDVPGMRACIVGDGPERKELESICEGDPRIEFTGVQDSISIRQWYRRTKVFVSAHNTEALGITFLEALSQGCVVAMPACGGGLEVALKEIGRQVQVFPISLDYGEVVSTLRRALDVEGSVLPMEAYSAKSVASAYLEVDSRRKSSIVNAAVSSSDALEDSLRNRNASNVRLNP
jgi:glycosyltransferase involved in cell wall biosynthesis